jgi:hypothetical protein
MGRSLSCELKIAMRAVYALFIMVILTMHQPATGATCRSLFEGTTPLSMIQLAQQYPDIGYPLRDPEGFTKEMNRRFIEAKARNPKDALSFDYSEVGIPAVEGMARMIPEKIKKLENWIPVIQRDGVLPFWFPEVLKSFVPKSLLTARGRRLESEVEIGITYLKELDIEISEILKRGSVD